MGLPIPSTASMTRARVRVRGAVQGVGFRPFVWSLAHELRLAGWVMNDAEGVLLEVEGAGLDAFMARLADEAPPLARIDAIAVEPREPAGDTAFAIRPSAKGAAAGTAISADAATCEACLEEICDPTDRRWGYAFTNCTHCGPRHTITRAVPYDRAQTSMADFAMCPSCQREYDDPGDRRFHAQPNACPDCGPQLSMTPREMVQRLQDGAILAIKGLGGFHLVVDAQNADAVARLRARKRRDAKPFAIMVAGLPAARRWAQVNAAEAALLTAHQRPIVICEAHADTPLAPGVSNGLPTLGLMLPYTPLHHLLFHAAAGQPAGTAWREDPDLPAFVMTSANPGGEPLVIDNDEAEARLAGIADVIITHDRAILTRSDDSVTRIIAGAPVFLRRARGWTPEPITLPRAIAPTLAVGASLKNTVCLTRGNEAFVSQHIGDLDNAATFAFFGETIAHLSAILEVTPTRVAADLHPDFLSSTYAAQTGLPLVRVQHHHAHIAAVMAEHHLDGPLLGLALDGFGLGADGASSWGGELILAQDARMTHLAGLSPLRQPGGDKAAREPWRMGAAALAALGRSDEIPQRFADQEGAGLLAHMVERGVNAPLTSSAGRLFDAACGLLNIKPKACFEGEAPMALEGLADRCEVMHDGWRITADGALSFLPLLEALAQPDMDARRGAGLFHGTLAAGLADWIARHIDAHALPRQVAASGGCLQNKRLTEALMAHLAAAKIDLHLSRRVSPNDGGLSLGQAWIAGQTDLPQEDCPSCA